MGLEKEGDRQSATLNTSTVHVTNMTVDVNLDYTGVVMSVIFVHSKACS